MLPLQTKTLPKNADDLAAELEKSLRLLVRSNPPVVTVQDSAYPHLAALRVALDDAVLPDTLPRQIGVSGSKPGLRVDHFEMTGRGLRVRGAKFDLACTARALDLAQAESAQGNVALIFQNAEEGALELAAPVAGLQTLLRDAAQKLASEQSVTIESLRLHLQARNDRELALVADVRAKKLFLSANVRLSARLTVDEKMNATVSALDCHGEGALGSLACNFLSPHLTRFSGRSFSLLALPLGGAKLRDIKISAGDVLRLSAKFGQPA